MQVNETQIRHIVEQVLQQLGEAQAAPSGAEGRDGQAKAQAVKAQQAMAAEPADYQGVPEAPKGQDPKEVVIGVGAAFQTKIRSTINGLPLEAVLENICAGIEEEGMRARVVKVLRTSDVCFMGLMAAKLSGSGIGIGLQSKGTTVIHQKDLYPLSNLELFPQAPLMSLETYRHVGKNAAKYVKGERVTPIKVENDPTVRPKYQVKAALMHIVETESLYPAKAAIDWPLA